MNCLKNDVARDGFQIIVVEKKSSSLELILNYSSNRLNKENNFRYEFRGHTNAHLGQMKRTFLIFSILIHNINSNVSVTELNMIH